MRGDASGNASAIASGSGGTGSPATRTAIGWASGLPSSSSASPRRPVTAAISRLPWGVLESSGASPPAASRRRSAASAARPSARVPSPRPA